MIGKSRVQEQLDKALTRAVISHECRIDADAKELEKSSTRCPASRATPGFYGWADRGSAPTDRAPLHLGWGGSQRKDSKC